MTTATKDKPQPGIRAMMRQAGETLLRDSGDDRADLDFAIARTTAVLQLLAAEREATTAGSRESGQ